MRIHFLGGANEVGGSCTLLEVAGRKLPIRVVDALLARTGPLPCRPLGPMGPLAVSRLCAGAGLHALLPTLNRPPPRLPKTKGLCSSTNDLSP